MVLLQIKQAGSGPFCFGGVPEGNAEGCCGDGSTLRFLGMEFGSGFAAGCLVGAWEVDGGNKEASGVSMADGVEDILSWDEAGAAKGTVEVKREGRVEVGFVIKDTEGLVEDRVGFELVALVELELLELALVELELALVELELALAELELALVELELTLVELELALVGIEVVLIGLELVALVEPVIGALVLVWSDPEPLSCVAVVVVGCVELFVLILSSEIVFAFVVFFGCDSEVTCKSFSSSSSEEHKSTTTCFGGAFGRASSSKSGSSLTLLSFLDFFLEGNNLCGAVFKDIHLNFVFSLILSNNFFKKGVNGN